MQPRGRRSVTSAASGLMYRKPATQATTLESFFLNAFRQHGDVPPAITFSWNVLCGVWASPMPAVVSGLLLQPLIIGIAQRSDATPGYRDGRGVGPIPSCFILR